jgi:hypothetical protein
MRVRRTILRHEARVMLLLQGHPAIPLLVGYHRVPHFEYLGMELLGKDLKSMVEPGHALKQGTVARIGAQMVYISLFVYQCEAADELGMIGVCFRASVQARVCPSRRQT